MSGPRGHDGPTLCEIKAINNLEKLLEELSEKYRVDKEDIMIGWSDIPPSDSGVLVYVCLSIYPTEYFRKNMLPSGRWVCRQYFRNEPAASPAQKGTYDYRNRIAYI